MGTNFTEYFSEYAKCYDDFDAERLIDYFYVPTFNVKNGTNGLSIIFMCQRSMSKMERSAQSHRRRSCPRSLNPCWRDTKNTATKRAT